MTGKEKKKKAFLHWTERKRDYKREKMWIHREKTTRKKSKGLWYGAGKKENKKSQNGELNSSRFLHKEGGTQGGESRLRGGGKKQRKALTGLG